MIILQADMFMDEALLNSFKKRAFTKIHKAAMQKAVKRWHVEILPKHFKRRAYETYGKQYGRKKKKGRPMVLGGQLQKSTLARIDISGTAKKVTGRMFFGRPKPLNYRQIRTRTFAKMKKNNSTFKQALRRTIAEQGNYAKNKLQFQLQIAAFSKKDVELMQEWVKDYIVDASKSTGNLKKVKRIK